MNTSHYMISKNFTTNKYESKNYTFNCFEEANTLVDQREGRFYSCFQKYLQFLSMKKSIFNEMEFPSELEYNKRFIKKFSESVHFKLKSTSGSYGQSVRFFDNKIEPSICDEFHNEFFITLLTLNFTLSELYSLILMFLNEINCVSDQINKSRFYVILNKVLTKEFMGYAQISCILKLIGIKLDPKQVRALCKQPQNSKHKLNIYSEIFDFFNPLSNEYVSLNKMMPFLFILFLVSQSKSLKYFCKHNKIDAIKESLIQYGMNTKSTSTKSISYRMVEKVLLDQSVLSDPKYKSSSNLIKAIKFKMKVNLVSNKEKEMLPFTSKDSEEISFGKWLTYKIQVFKMYEQSKAQAKEISRLSSEEKKNIVVKMLKAEKFMYMIHVFEEFNQQTVNDRVYNTLIGLNKKVCLIEDYIFALTKSLKYFSLSFSAGKAQLMIYYFVCDLVLQKATDEFNKIFKTDIEDIELNKFTIKKMNRLEIRNVSLLCNYSYFMLKREADRVLSLVFFMINISDFKKVMNRHLNKNTRQEKKIAFIYQFDVNDSWEMVKKAKKHKRRMTPLFHKINTKSTCQSMVIEESNGEIKEIKVKKIRKLTNDLLSAKEETK